jgi:hypothetical protein
MMTILVLKHPTVGRDLTKETEEALIKLSLREIFVIPLSLSSQMLLLAKDPQRHVELVVWHHTYPLVNDTEMLINIKDVLGYGTPVLCVRSKNESYSHKEKMRKWIQRFTEEERLYFSTCLMMEYPEKVQELMLKQHERMISLRN